MGELIVEASNGFLFTPGDVNDFVRAATTLNNRKEALANSRSVIRATIEPYALAHYVDNLLADARSIIRA